MRHARLMFMLLLGLAGCQPRQAPPSVGYLPADAFGGEVVGQDQAAAALNAATVAFAYPGTMQGRPAQMALAVAALDAMAGQFASGGRWMTMDWVAQQEMLDARVAVRARLGVVADAPSQAVVDALVAAAQALERGDKASALAALSAPIFTRPPEQLLALLAHFPRVPAANRATMEATRDFYPAISGGSGAMD